MAFVKLDCNILTSTIWIDRVAREVFLTALLMAEPREITEPMREIKIRSLDRTDFEVPPGWYGFVAAAGVGIVRMACVDQEEGMNALERLSSPEAESRTPDFDGRRLVRVDGGFIVLNFQKHRDRDHGSTERGRRFRARKSGQIMSNNVKQCNGETPLRNGETPLPTQAEAEAEAEKPIHAEPVAPLSPAMPIKPFSKSALQARVDGLFRRRPTTPWSKSERKAWETAQAVVADTTEEDWLKLEAWFALPITSAPFRRTDMAALLNNWHAEFTKAERNKSNGNTDTNRKITSRSFESGKDVDYSRFNA